MDLIKYTRLITYKNFEINLRFLLNDLSKEPTIEDYLLLDDIKHTIIIFSMKDRFNDTDTIFLENMKNEFYESINELEIRHDDIKLRTKLIKDFMETLYFNN
jgi:hypothetical protein